MGDNAKRRSRRHSALAAEREPIAIVGMGCRFPGAAGPEAFWQLLLDGRDAIVPVPQNRWDANSLHHRDPVSAPGTIRIRLGGFINDIDRFDPGFFGISPREATAMDPQQRLLLETGWEAIEDAGIALDRCNGAKIGVFVGIAAYDYAEIQHSYDNRQLIGPHTNTGIALSIAANRLSHFFDFRGPSVAVDTACSSSLVAVHLACRSLIDRESDMALVGGVNAILKPEATVGFSRASMLAPDGRCKPFDARANGYARGEGAGVVVLKRLADAVESNDHVYAVIRGSAVNQDGRTPGISVPSRAAQEAVIAETLEYACIDPSTIHYVEAHGTGTPVGDPIEAHALGTILGKNRSGEDPCLIGSVKTNIGHLEAAAGIAGLIKTALAIERRHIPATLNFVRPNPDIPLEELKLSVVGTPRDWPSNKGPARAGVNSFGFGGTNAHVVLEERPPVATPEYARGEPSVVLFPLSARTPEALREVATKYADAIDAATGTDLEALGYWATRRQHHDQRAGIVAHSAKDLTAAMRGIADSPTKSRSIGTAAPRRLAFVYSGMGAQWWGMGRQLLAGEPVFRRAVEECDALFAPRARWSLLDELTASEDASRMDRTEVAQPCNLAVQLGLTALWRAWGVTPEIVVGHSAGEIAACHVAGVLSLEDAIEVAFHRSRLQQTTAGYGKMVATGLALDEARQRIASYGEIVSIAAVNGPKSTTLSGDGDSLGEIVAQLENEGIFARFLRVDVAYHSHAMAPIEGALRAALAGLTPRLSELMLVSTVSGAAVKGIAYDADYWWRNIRQPVEFSAAISCIANLGCDAFIEISPHPILSGDVSSCLTALDVASTVLPSARRARDERTTMLRSLGELYTRGHNPDWGALYPNPKDFVSLPSYPWQHQPYWNESRGSRARRLTEATHPLLGRRRAGPRLEWDNLIDGRVDDYLRDHRIEGSVVYPAAAYVEMALAAAQVELGTPVVVETIAFERTLLLPEAGSIATITSYDSESGLLTIEASADDERWDRFARGTIQPCRKRAGNADLAALKRACPHELAGIYDIFAQAGLDYGSEFRGLEGLWHGVGEALAQLRPAPEASNYIIHPTVLDAAFQVLLGALASAGGASHAYLPVGIGRVVVYQVIDPGTTLWAHAVLREHGETRIRGDVRLLDANGTALVEVVGLACRRLGATRAAERRGDTLYRYRWCADNSLGATPKDLPDPALIADSVRPTLADIVDVAERELYYREIEPALNRAAVLVAANGLARLGLGCGPNHLIDPDMLAASIGIGHKRRLLGRMLAILESGGFVRREGNAFRVVIALETAPSIATILSPLSHRFPLYKPEIDMMRRCGESLDSVIRGEVEPLEVIFPRGSLSVADEIYGHSRSFSIYNEITREAVKAVVRAVPETAMLRVLEIGAGTGSLTAQLFEILPADRIQYVFSDISPSFLQKAMARFAPHRFVEYRLLDIEAAPEEQGFSPGAFDIVIAADVLHATHDIGRSLAHAAELLAPGGLLIALELTRPPFWFDLVFGLLPGWWSFEDTDLRTNHACIGGAEWRKVMLRCGFDEVELLNDSRAQMDTVHSVIMGRRAARAIGALPREEPGLWLLLGDRGGYGARLEAALVRAGGQSITAELNSSEDVGRVIDTMLARAPRLRGIVSLRALDYRIDDHADASAVLGAVEEICGISIRVMQALGEQSAIQPPRLLLVTSGAESVLNGERADPIQASLWGLARVFRNEAPGIPCRLIDLPADPTEADLGLLAIECLDGDAEAEIAMRVNERFVHRLEAVSVSELADGSERPRRDGEAFRLGYNRAGSLENLSVRAVDRIPPKLGEIEIEVAAAGLNFRDVMTVLGIYPGETTRLELGDECAGTIVAIGDGVECFDLEVGDRVVALASGFGAYATVAAERVVPLPDAVSFAEGATLPITFITAVFALQRLGQLRAGERVLIHAAAGGVGQAAVQVAQAVGATVFATAGSDQKRDFLRAQGIEYVMDSRGLEFAHEILQLTHGEGIDVVLNSLSGRAIAKGMAVLRPHGRFLEIGKTDIYRDSKIGLYPFRHNLSYFGIDLDALFATQPSLARNMLLEVVDAVASRRYRPLPHEVYPISEAEKAFRYMAQARQIGKIVLDLADQSIRLLPQRLDPFPLRADGTYLISGGLGGLGRALASWLVEEGARDLVLIGRSGAASSAAQADVERLREAGVTVRVIAADISDEAALHRQLARVRREAPPLRGVFHAAMVLDDGLIARLGPGELHRVLKPKIAGAWALHHQTLNDPLDIFVLFSSFTAVVGNVGQGNYAAANAVLDALAHYRRSEGRPALSVAWGAISGHGYVAQRAGLERHFEQRGLKSLPPDQAFATLKALLRSRAIHIGVADINWATWARHAPAVAHLTQFRPLLNGSGVSGGGEDSKGLTLDKLRAASFASRKGLMLHLIREQLAAVLGLSADEVDENKPLYDIGLDSLMAVELSALIEERLGIRAGSIELTQAPSAAALAERFIEKIAT
jgi:acyl transferase domain-containing protein/NADPH:quinone reductase-like Zn-dependent oxidoreductase/SAM-dependent methyltransferase/NAD(P)-dependent dehydrogenase (short-subunit alcohol dehydrogenase family)/acyl carrier protein